MEAQQRDETNWYSLSICQYNWNFNAEARRSEQEKFLSRKKQIGDLISAYKGSWAEWKFVFDAFILLDRCRVTLQNSYPKAYFMPAGIEKNLFEYQQKQFQTDVDRFFSELQLLIFNCERTSLSSIGSLEDLMKRLYKRCTDWLKDFFIS